MGIISRIFRRESTPKVGVNPSLEGRIKLLRFLIEEHQFQVNIDQSAEVAVWADSALNSSEIYYFSKDGTPKWNSHYFNVKDSVDTVIETFKKMIKDGKFKYEVRRR